MPEYTQAMIFSMYHWFYRNKEIKYSDLHSLKPNMHKCAKVSILLNLEFRSYGSFFDRQPFLELLLEETNLSRSPRTAANLPRAPRTSQSGTSQKLIWGYYFTDCGRCLNTQLLSLYCSTLHNICSGVHHV